MHGRLLAAAAAQGQGLSLLTLCVGRLVDHMLLAPPAVFSSLERCQMEIIFWLLTSRGNVNLSIKNELAQTQV